MAQSTSQNGLTETSKGVMLAEEALRVGERPYMPRRAIANVLYGGPGGSRESSHDAR